MNTRAPLPTPELAHKLGQLEAQLRHLPEVSPADYPCLFTFTQQFAEDVITDLERTIMNGTTIPLPQEELLTFKEAMSYLRISRSTLYRLMWSGHLIGHKVGSTWRFYRSDLRTCISPILTQQQS